ncbi:phosphatidate cytidylyltransferase [Verrucomicrobium sp. GAS474]|uniref:phosphatidate cytidylyltransferase n=1 Tax=Verrucomicrobium sp. GAS474 TaxID=1882831 RepID=UPI0008795CF2|nr:CDP-archaeol synthase [Verrucomicrobium sp. GAS474]SDU24146.1 phosphatidate cytidylyltransferase [Verrucomicrobium sp. GAS474]
MGVSRSVLLRRGFSTLLLWGIVLWILLSGSKLWPMVLLSVSGLLAQWEFYQIQREKKLRVFRRWGVFCGLLLYVGCGIILIGAPRYIARIDLLEQAIFVLLTIGVLVRVVLSKEAFETPIVTVALTLLGFFYIPFLFTFFARLAFWPGATYQTAFILFYLLAVTKFCDAGAFVAGSLAGKHKMIPRISPGKTWEGFAGGVALSVVISVLLIHYFPKGLPDFGLWDGVCLGTLLALASVVGDLAESVVKRDAQIKDSGRFIPGIGGALDLIDSILFTAPVFYFYVQFRVGFAW